MLHIIEVVDSYKEVPLYSLINNVYTSTLAERPQRSGYCTDHDPCSLLSTAGNEVPINFECNRVWNDEDGTFQFTASWRVPQFQSLLQAIGTFDLGVWLVRPHQEGGSGEQEGRVQQLLQFEVSKEGSDEGPINYVYLYTELFRGMRGQFYKIGVIAKFAG